mmetsp:Transcript_35685/g.60790  ORF Transcript_35685/g.60790 Transcript_35685/m.60790 type:complete len:109 (-) Transcript_35685:1120-1446(-)
MFQICPNGSPARERKTTTQTSPAKMDSMRCSKYSIPNLDATSNANKLPPSGTPKKADNAPAMPIKVCFLTTLRLVCLKIDRDTNPAVAAHMATNGASGPKDAPAKMVH